MARSIADGITADPKEKARTISSIAEGCSRYPVDYSSVDEPYKLARQVHDYIGDAAEAAQQAEHPATRSSALVEVAEVSAKSTEQLAKNIATNGYKGDLEVYDRLFKELEQQPLSIYGQALTAAGEAGKPAQRIREHSRIVVSMARSAANITYGEAFISEELVNMAVSEIVETVKGCESSDGQYAKMSAAQKANSLLQLGSEMGAAIERQYGKTHQLATSPLRRDLIRQTAQTFLKARDYGQKISPAAKVLSSAGIARNQYELDRGASYSTLTFANRIIEADFGLAKRVLAAGFDLATLHDAAAGDTFRRDEALIVINNNADSNQRTVEEAFELFSLSHTLSGRFRGKSKRHGAEMQRKSADNALRLLARSRSYEVTKLEKIDSEFVNFMIKSATEEGSEIRSGQLHALSAYVDDPQVIHAIYSGVEVLSLREQAAKEPQNDTARIVHDVIGRQI